MDLEKVVKGIGVLAGAFNPALGDGIIALSSVAKVFSDVDDKKLEDVKGLSYVSKSLRDMVEEDNFDRAKMLELAKVVDDISLILEKNLKLIK